MEQNLKQRLVGAVVITSLAAIFVPMLFDDPIDETGKMIGELSIPKVPKKAFDIKLPKSAEEVISLPKPEPLKTLELKQTANKMVRWFVQAGSFSKKSNAVILQNKIRKQGFPVRTSLSKNGMYKVRLGPVLNKKRAELMKTKIDKANNIKSIVSSVDK
jgi:DedD protein